MNVNLLVDGVVRQTTLLIAQLATAGGLRAPLAHVANQVFVELASELERQGLSNKVTADMFGITLRTYQRRMRRLRESATERGRTLWEAVHDYLQKRSVVTRRELLRRFHRDEEESVRGILRDLVESGLVFRSGTDPDAVYRLATPDELGEMQSAIRNSERQNGLDELVWVIVHREGPIDLSRDSDTDADGIVDERVTNTYDEKGNHLSEHYDDGTVSGYNYLFTPIYDASGNLISADEESDVDWDYVLDTRSHITYDAMGNAVKEERDVGFYDEEGNLIAADGIVDIIVTSAYDDRGNLIRTEDDFEADGTVDFAVTHTFDEEGNLVSTEYDDDGDSVIDSCTVNTHDDRGNLLRSEWDADGDGVIDTYTAYTYDEQGNLLSDETDNPDAIVRGRRYVYDERGNLVSTTYDFDGDGAMDLEVIATFDEYGHQTRIEYDFGVDGAVGYTQNHDYTCS